MVQLPVGRLALGAVGLATLSLVLGHKHLEEDDDACHDVTGDEQAAKDASSEYVDIVDTDVPDRFMDVFTVRCVAVSAAGLLIDPAVVLYRTVILGLLQGSWEGQ